jgi:hypothetical protein
MNQKQTSIFLLAIVFLILLGNAGFYFYNKDKQNKLSIINQEISQRFNQLKVEQQKIQINDSLIKAAQEQDLTKIQELIKAGADINASGGQALGYASAQGNLEIVKELIKAGADINDSNALRFASSSGYIDVVKELITAGADVNVKDSNGKTALIYASESRLEPIESVKELITAGADVNVKDFSGGTALIYASNTGNYKIVKALKDAGAKE